jgi:hypothetical protein
MFGDSLSTSEFTLFFLHPFLASIDCELSAANLLFPFDKIRFLFSSGHLFASATIYSSSERLQFGALSIRKKKRRM